ncbi:MAG: pilus assembly FimT family protein [Methylococcales bacterium]
MRFEAPKQRGLTAIEFLIALSGVVVLAAFTGSIWIGSRAHAEVDKAVKSVNASITAARQAARIYNTEIVLYLPADPNATQVMYYTVPSTAVTGLLSQYERIGFPALEGVYVVSDADSIRFNAAGVAVPPVQLVLVSSTENSIAADVLVQ